MELSGTSVAAPAVAGTVALKIGFSGGHGFLLIGGVMLSHGFLLSEGFPLTESLADPATSLDRNVLGEWAQAALTGHAGPFCQGMTPPMA